MTDPAGAVVADAAATITSEASGLTRTTTTNTNGPRTFRVRSIRPARFGNARIWWAHPTCRPTNAVSIIGSIPRLSYNRPRARTATQAPTSSKVQGRRWWTSVSNFPIREKIATSLRLEMFNSFNHPNFTFNPTGTGLVPIVAAGSASAGIITRTYDPRRMQGALKIKS